MSKSGLSGAWNAVGSLLLAGAIAARYYWKPIVTQPKAAAAAASTAAAAVVKADSKSADLDLKYIADRITAHADFPKKGVLFRDIFPVFRDPVAIEMLLTRLVAHIQSTYGRVDVICGLDSRGFLFGPTLAIRLGASFVPIRKTGKLPGKCHTVSYVKEYGKDEFDIQVDAIKPKQTVIIIDDLLATGGTMLGAIALIERVGAIPLECLVVIELADMNGRAKIAPVPVHTILTMSWNYCNRGLDTNYDDAHRGFMNVTLANKFEYAPNQGYDTIAHRFPMATFASCKYAIPSKHSHKPAPPLPLPFVTDVPDVVMDAKHMHDTTKPGSAPTQSSLVIVGNYRALDNTARNLALAAYTRDLHATTINPSQHPTQSSVVPIGAELSRAGVLGASSDLKADGRKQYRGTKYDQSGTGRVMIEQSALTLTAQLHAPDVAAKAAAALAASSSSTSAAPAASASAAADGRPLSPAKKPASPLVARLASSPYHASPRPGSSGATKVRFQK